MDHWYPSSKRIALIANADLAFTPAIQSSLKDYSTIIAVDGGLRHCKSLGIIPELIIGDFDSASSQLLSTYSEVPQMKTPDPNKTDLEKALEFILSFDPIVITVFAALGNRVDHTLTNICLLTRYPGKVIFETDLERIWALEKSVTLSCRKGQTLSLIPLNGEVTGITTKGLKWDLHEGILDKQFIGISNVCQRSEIFIEHLTGDLVLCLHH